MGLRTYIPPTAVDFNGYFQAEWGRFLILLPGSRTLDYHCPHFGRCGGCACRKSPNGQWAPLPYAEELRAKQARVHERLAPFDVGEWSEIHPSPQLWHYRNKMELAFGSWNENNRQGPVKHPLLLGLREAGHFNRVVDLEACGLMSAEGVDVVRQVRAWAKTNGYTGYHRTRHEGDLRYLVLREGKNTGERLALLIASAGKHLHLSGLESLRPLVSSFGVGTTSRVSDVARSEDVQWLWGPGSVTEAIGGVRFRISPTSFFQTNSQGAAHLYQLLEKWASGIGGTLIDLYCGSGGIGCVLARHFDRVVGVDINPEAIADAQRNAQDNGFSHMEFVAEEAGDFLKRLGGSKLSVQLSAVVVDPPRPGLSPAALAVLVGLNAPHLAYVSCNPDTLARDLQTLVPFYRITAVIPVDLFPHTPHVETLVTLAHR